MATTISNATMTVTVNEDVKLNGYQVGSKVVQKISNINEASRRIMSVPTSTISILTLGSTAGAGGFVTGDLKYIRVSNLDDTNFVRLTFVSGSANKFDMKLPASRTAIFTSAAISGSNSGTTFDAFSNFDTMQAISDTAVVDIELFVAST